MDRKTEMLIGEFRRNSYQLRSMASHIDDLVRDLCDHKYPPETGRGWAVTKELWGKDGPFPTKKEDRTCHFCGIPDIYFPRGPGGYEP